MSKDKKEILIELDKQKTRYIINSLRLLQVSSDDLYKNDSVIYKHKIKEKVYASDVYDFKKLQKFRSDLEYFLNSELFYRKIDFSEVIVIIYALELYLRKLIENIILNDYKMGVSSDFLHNVNNLYDMLCNNVEIFYQNCDRYECQFILKSTYPTL